VHIETIATGLFRLQNYEGKGFVDIISHSGTTLSPGELLIRGGFTDVTSAMRTGRGCVTAAIKTFPSFMYETVIEAVKNCRNDNIRGLFEIGYLMPPKYQMSIKDRTRGYMLVLGGANYLAPLLECGISTILSISSGLYDIEEMRPPHSM
jgi:repressor of nif and glnA expression